MEIEFTPGFMMDTHYAERMRSGIAVVDGQKFAFLEFECGCDEKTTIAFRFPFELGIAIAADLANLCFAMLESEAKFPPGPGEMSVN